MEYGKGQPITDELHQFIEALTVAIDARDRYTARHSYRVAEMSGNLARALGWSEEEAGMIHIAGHLHDIGKIGVPDAVLKKPGLLTDDEFKLIQQHSEIGWRIVSQIGALEAVAPCVRSHHERIDGRGYPDGLKGEAIPVGARIIAVADAFDAMLSQRPYRRARPLERVIEEMVDHRGSQFDPEILDRFLTLAEDFHKRYYLEPVPEIEPVAAPVDHGQIRHSLKTSISDPNHII